LGSGTNEVPTTTTNDIALAQNIQPQREDRDFPWGLLGLLGLAGLLGRKRRDDDHDHRSTTGTSTIRP
jgi:MYXO-CTERM domain-containing protein